MERPGPGLGVVAFRPASPDGSREEERLSLFVANDHFPNFYLRNSPAANSENLQLSDLAFQTGLAVNRDGKATAHMGIASGDVNGDGLLDLFVTNYKDEAKLLFVQGADGLFADSIAGTGLMEPGLPYVGWGTQFFDADHDGKLDLAVANGHVADFDKPGVDYAMPTQFFRGIGAARFVELRPEAAGPFFAEKRFGRSLATLDWNRDGLTDFVMSSIASRAALLTNESKDTGHWLAVRLHGTQGPRDAIGAIVTVKTAKETTRTQLTGGDGYQATNERVVRFGLGRQAEEVEVTIEWPGGAQETIPGVPVDRLLEVVEGQPRRTLWIGGEARPLQ
jgi:hypothetical protein